MAQLFQPGADTILRFSLLIAAGTTVAALALGTRVWSSDFTTGVGVAPAQPVPFSHKHHSGQLGVDCRYCHTSVEQAASAGIPPTYTCMSCHSQIWTGSEMLAPVRQSLAEGEPLRWSRVNDLPDYVYFNHGIHISKGVGCSSCHGEVTAMQLTYRAQAFHMSFCLDCHRAPEKYLRPEAEIWNMTWEAPADQEMRGAALVREHGIQADRLDECSNCHR